MIITLKESLILGIIQGLTEFIPVSSSAHLVIFQHLFGLNEPVIFFDICLHLGTLLAVILFLKDDLRSILIEITKLFISEKENNLSERWATLPYVRFCFFAILATIPTALIGFIFKDKFEAMFSSVPGVGLMLMVTGIILFLTKRYKTSHRGMGSITFFDALIIGCAQGLAIAPGISRSGTTISFGIFRGISQDIAARFSFLLSIPAIMGAAVLKFDSSITLQGDIFSYAAGTIAATITGYFSLKILSSMIRKGQLSYFSPYCIIVGTLSLLSAFF
jgi:undecaprenyl-diphosphatase